MSNRYSILLARTSAAASSYGVAADAQQNGAFGIAAYVIATMYEDLHTLL